MAKRNTKKSIQVYAHWLGMELPLFMGTLSSNRLKGKEVFSFEYDDDWLRNGPAQLLDPNLQLYSGLHYLNEVQDNFGLFLDSSPDRWGRILMRRREAALARVEAREEHKLFETDYLLGVFDGHRMGALRFKLEEAGPFLNDNETMASPPWTSLRELEQISLRLEDEDVLDDPEYLRWLSMLIAPGTSLGGARPKASITDTDGGLWIAKFPSRNDQGDIGGWEIVTYELALMAGISMAESKAQKFSSNYYTFLTKRFDRGTDGQRIHFASAMTMLGYTDGQDHVDGASYLELVEFIQNNGANVEQDLEQLWRRIVFSICVTNTDDHLRNHGFILTNYGWILSPAYDINPVETGTGLKLNISDVDNSLDLDLALEVAVFFRLSEERANEIIDEVWNAVGHWKDVATKYGISRLEQELKSLAFKTNRD
ncbi:serine/threonine-protein kinase HipA [Gelidibacter algens]|uniref:Serine/threonine-protein kinase HipA n=1 Tax=Gelidibacter algens TaxID=49280 RepID=A0A1A7R4M3_9FLAO|nr:HipA domain-containing protein [Gelidibacter algens]OBX25712.1 toxin HipA [Gelidibacter algens]RAJ21048.1 serine/threonine-protein kinase HipA [Gelidibacter algens]